MDADRRLIEAQIAQINADTKIRQDRAQHELVTSMRKESIAFSHEQYNRQANIKIQDCFVPTHPPIVGSVIPKSVRKAIYQVPYTTLKPMGLTSLSGEKIVTDNRFTPAKSQTQTLPVILMKPNSGLTKKGSKVVWATLISLAYGSGNDEEDLDPRDLYAAYITWMSTCVVGITQNGLDEALKEQDLRVEITWVDGDTELVDAVTERFPGVLDVLQSIYEDGRANSDDIFAIAAVLIQTIGRKPTELSFSKWWMARLKTTRDNQIRLYAMVT